jgi:hypothetical protein
MHDRSVLLIGLLILIGAPTALSAAARLPTFGAAEGVTATLSAEHIELRLTGPAAAAAARYIGRGASIDCASPPASRPDLCPGQWLQRLFLDKRDGLP